MLDWVGFLGDCSLTIGENFLIHSGRMFSEWWQNKNGIVAGLNGIGT